MYVQRAAVNSDPSVGSFLSPFINVGFCMEYDRYRLNIGSFAKTYGILHNEGHTSFKFYYGFWYLNSFAIPRIIKYCIYF